jgi:hypothetical protein
MSIVVASSRFPPVCKRWPRTAAIVSPASCEYCVTRACAGAPRQADWCRCIVGSTGSVHRRGVLRYASVWCPRPPSRPGCTTSPFGLTVSDGPGTGRGAPRAAHLARSIQYRSIVTRAHELTAPREASFLPSESRVFLMLHCATHAQNMDGRIAG